MDCFEAEGSPAVLESLFLSISAKLARVRPLLARRAEVEELEFMRAQIDSMVYQKTENMLLELELLLHNKWMPSGGCDKLDLSKFYEIGPNSGEKLKQVRDQRSYGDREMFSELKKSKVSERDYSSGKASMFERAKDSVKSSYSLKGTPEKPFQSDSPPTFKTVDEKGQIKKTYSVLSQKHSRSIERDTDALISELKRNIDNKTTGTIHRQHPRKVLASTLFGKSGLVNPKKITPVLSYLDNCKAGQVKAERESFQVQAASLLNCYRSARYDLNVKKQRDVSGSTDKSKSRPIFPQEVLLNPAKKKTHCFKALDSSTSGSKWQSLFLGGNLASGIASPGQQQERRQDKRRGHIGLFGKNKKGNHTEQSDIAYVPKSYYQSTQMKLSRSSDKGTERKYSRSKSSTSPRNLMMNYNVGLAGVSTGHSSFQKGQAIGASSTDRSSDMLKLKYGLLLIGSSGSRPNLSSLAAGPLLNVDFSSDRAK